MEAGYADAVPSPQVTTAAKRSQAPVITCAAGEIGRASGAGRRHCGGTGLRLRMRPCPGAYNRAMRAAHTLLLLALASAPALAQNTSQNATQPTADGREQLSKQEHSLESSRNDGRRNQRMERIVVEDAGSRVDELRVGGQTQSITVQPKTGTPLPAYQVQSNDGARARPGNFNESDTITAPRVWNLRKF